MPNLFLQTMGRQKRKASAGVGEATAAAASRRRRTVPPPSPHSSETQEPPQQQDGIEGYLHSISNNIADISRRQDEFDERLASATANRRQEAQAATGPPDQGPVLDLLQGIQAQLSDVANRQDSFEEQLQNISGAEHSREGFSSFQSVLHPDAQALAEEILDKEIEEGTGEPVDLFVDQKTKNKILSHEAVDFSLLINKKQKHTGRWLLTDNEEGASVSHIAGEKSVLQKHQWVEAWNIFQAIYLGEHNSKRVIRGLAVHFANVHRLMTDNGDWAMYDLSFRKMVERNPRMWGDTHSALYSRALNSRNMQNMKKQAQPLTQQSSKKSRVPAGWCIDHHAHSKCTRNPCPWNHMCFHCRVADHPASRCHIQGGNTKMQDQSFRKKAAPSSSYTSSNSK